MNRRWILVVALVVTMCACQSQDSAPSEGAPAPSGHLAWGAWDPDGNLHLYTAAADGSDARALLPEGGMEQPKWSPDGSTIAVAGPNGDQIVGGLIAADGTGFHLFAPPDRTLNAACVLWSPDGIRLACEVWDDDHPGRHGVYTVRAADGGDLQRVTRGRDIPCAWSPDGSQLVFMRSGSDEDRFFLMIARSDGGWERRLGFVEVGGACDWSPDGRTILTELDGSLLLVDLDGKVNPIHIQAPAGATYTWSSRPAFSPDGSSIVFSFDAGDGQADIYTIRTNGSDLTRITDTPNDGEEFADWGP